MTSTSDSAGTDAPLVDVGHVPLTDLVSAHGDSPFLQMTGLPIDFQIQPTTWANEKFPQRDGNVRSALLELRTCNHED